MKKGVWLDGRETKSCTNKGRSEEGEGKVVEEEKEEGRERTEVDYSG